MSTELTISCCLCGEKHVAEIELPQGWKLRYDGIDEEGGFCPSHSIITEWANSQCPGCVGGWQECDLWNAFAYDKRGLNKCDFDMIKSGICPRRTNGTFMATKSGFHDMDLSKRANPVSGEALAKAIVDYWDKYGTGEDRA